MVTLPVNRSFQDASRCFRFVVENVMPIAVGCPKCGATLNAPDQAAGKGVRCKCGAVVPVPGSNPSSAQPVSQAKSSPAPQSPAGGKKAAAAPAVSPSLIDHLTDRDHQQFQQNPYAPPPKTSTSDATFLRTYVKDDGKAAKAKSNQGNLVLLIVCNAIGGISNLIGGIALFALANFAENVTKAMPILGTLGAIGAVLMLTFAAFDIATMIGLVMKKPWGWWLATIGLGWGIANGLSNVAVNFLTAEDAPGSYLIGQAVGALVVLGIMFMLLNFLISDDTRKLFKVNIPAGAAWGISLGVGLVLGGILFGIGMAVGASAAAAARPSVPSSGPP
jgi:hypothetical protein